MIDTFEQDLNALMDASPKVAEYIHEQQYLMDTSSEGVTDEFILNSAYAIILKELQERGIICFTNIDDVLSSWYTARYILSLYLITEPNDLIDFFKTHIALIPVLEQLLISDLPNNELYSNFFDILEPHHLSNETFINANALQHDFTANEDFIHLLQLVFDRAESYQFTIEQNPNTIIDSLREKLDDRNKFINLLQLLSSHIYDSVNIDFVRTELEKYDGDKIAPGNIDMFTWIYLCNKNTGTGTIYDPTLLPKNLLKKQQDFLDNHHRTVNHHIEYYLNNTDIEITNDHLTLLMISRYDESKEDTDSSLTELLTEMIAIAGDRFTDKHIEFLTKLKDLMLKLG